MHIHKITIKYVRPLSIVINYTRVVKKTFRKINYKTWPNSLSPRSRKFEKNILYFWSSSLKSANDVKKDQFFLKVYLGKVILIHDVKKYKCSLITKMNDVVLTYALTQCFPNFLRSRTIKHRKHFWRTTKSLNRYSADHKLDDF